MDFHHLLKILVKIQLKLLQAWTISIAKNFLIVLKKYLTDVIKTASKRTIQKAAETIGDLIGNKIAHKITSISKSAKKLRTVQKQMRMK